MDRQQAANGKQQTIFLSLGSNLGNKTGNLQKALEEIAERIGTISAVSSVIETDPWGYQSPNSFLNMVVRVETNLSPSQVLNVTQTIEKNLGRTTKSSDSYQDRLIDIDIILYDNLILNSSGLTLPHPHLHERLFVLEPLCEIAPDLIHPTLKKTIKELLTNFSEK